MRVFNKDKTIELTEFDLSKGYLKDDVLVKHIDEVQAVEEKGHYETIKEYPNGGKDVEYVIDVEGVKYQPARDEEEQIKVYIPFTEKELKEIEYKYRILKIKQSLAETDYRAIKYAEGEYTEEQYAPYKKQRQEWRDEINRLEVELGITIDV